MPGTGEAIEAAAGQGYEACLLVVVVLAMLGAFGILSRFLLSTTSAREKALSDRIIELEAFIQTTLVRLLEECKVTNNAATKAMGQLLDRLDSGQ